MSKEHQQCFGVKCPEHVLRAIYSEKHIVNSESDEESEERKLRIDELERERKLKEYDDNLRAWWAEYAQRKNAEDEEHVCDSLLYDFSHLPRNTPAPNFLNDRVLSTTTKKKTTTTTTETETETTTAATDGDGGDENRTNTTSTTTTTTTQATNA
jgi:hypothetical protein